MTPSTLQYIMIQLKAFWAVFFAYHIAQVFRSLKTQGMAGSNLTEGLTI